MKINKTRNQIVIIFLIYLFLALAGCNWKSVSIIEETSESLNKSETDIRTPSLFNSTSTDLNLLYPIENSLSTQTPNYLSSGFVTLTPDPLLSNIVISEVRHENDVEVIVIKNIGASAQDIGSYIIYSPGANERKVLPKDLVLQSGDTYSIYNGSDLSVFPEEQGWMKNAVLTTAFDEVWILNNAGRIMYYFTYYP